MKPLNLLFVAVLGVAVAGGAGEQDGAATALDPGIEPFIRARILESTGRYREAVTAYERALEAAPEIREIRIRFASLLLDLGLSDRAVTVLEGSGELDWFGDRVLALALAQDSVRNPQSSEAAEEALRKALAERDDDPNLQLSLGQLLHRQGRTAEAEAVISKLRETRGGSPQLAAYHAGLLRQLGRKQEAAQVYAECAASQFPGSQDCRESLVQLLVELGRPGEAGELMLQWLTDADLDSLMRAAGLLYEGGRYDEALAVVRRVLRLAPDSPRASSLEAYLLSRLGRYQEAADRLRELQRRQRNDVEVLVTLAWVTANLGEIDDARRWIDRAWEVVEKDAASQQAVRVALTAARVELVAESGRRAREWLDRVDPSTGGAGELVFLLAETYRRDEDWEGGISAMLRLQPRLPDAGRLEARAYEAEFRLRLGDRRGAALLDPLLESDDRREVLIALGILQGLERWHDVDTRAAGALDRMPGDRDLLFTRAAALERLGRVDEAADLFRQLVEADSEDAAAANYLGYTWADQGINLDEALDLISRAVAIEPDNAAYLDSLGWVHYRLGDLDQAEYWLRRAVGLSAGDGTVLSHLGEVLLRRGQTEEARRMLRQALDAGCEHPDHVQELLEEIGSGE